MQITYQKRDGCVFQKYRKTMLPYQIGDTTSMGWKVLNIEYEYNNNYYSEYDYNLIIHKKNQRYIRIQQIKEICIRNAKTLLYNIIGILILYYIKIRIGI